MDAGLLSLAMRRLAEMSETEAENEITRLRSDELASLLRYCIKKERGRLAPQADVGEVAIRTEHRKRSPSLEVVSTRPCRKQRTHLAKASEVASSRKAGKALDVAPPATRSSKSIAPSNAGRIISSNHSQSTNGHASSARDGVEELARIEPQSTTVASRTKLSILGVFREAKDYPLEKPMPHVLWIPDTKDHWRWVSHDELPEEFVNDLVQLLQDKLFVDTYRRREWAGMIRGMEFHVNRTFCVSEWVYDEFVNESMSLGYSKGERNRACDRCIDAYRPCLRLVRLNNPAEIAIGWFPLPNIFRGKDPKSQEFWVKAT